MRNVRLCLSVALCLLTAVFAFGQENSGKIQGTVTDDSGASVPDAKLTATSPTTPRGFETTSDSLGRYQFPTVPIGIYTVTATRPGFNTARQTNIQVNLGSEVTFNPKLSVSTVTQTIEVSEAAVSLDTTSSRTSTNITAAQLDGIAKGRTFNSILAMAPGVRQEVKGGNAGVGGIQVDGSSGLENAYIIDGVEVTDVKNGSLRAANAIPFEFLSEVQVKSGGFEAEYGGATGGVINVATRSGSNDFHGLVNFDFTNDALNASDRGYWQRFGSDNHADFVRPKEDAYRIFYPGFTFGGPILKDRLFFFAGYQPELEHTDRTINYPAGTKTFTQDRTRHYATGRLDFSPARKVQINSSYLWSPAKRTGSLPNRDPRVAAPTNDLSVQGGFLPAQAYTVSTTYSATARLVLQARYGYRYLNDKDGNYGLSGAPYVVYQTASSAAPGIPAEFAGPTGFRNVSSTFGVINDITTRHNVYLDGTYIANLAGQQHTFKAGYALNRVANQHVDDYTNGLFNVYWGDAFNRGSVNNARGTYGYYIWDDGVRHNSGVNGRNMGFYFQDSWKVHPRLTLNLGVRFENEFLPPYRAEQEGKKIANPVAFGWGDKVAPRLGVAWDVNGDGKWRVAGSYGLFYDVMKYNLAEGSFGGDFWISHVYALNSPNVFSLSKTNPGLLGPALSTYDNRRVDVNPTTGELEGQDPNMKPYTSREFTFSLDHQLAPRLVAGVRYTRKDLLKLIEDIGILDGDDEVYEIGNPGFGLTRDPKSPWGKKTPNGKEWLFPKGVRRYDGLEFRLQGQAKALTFVASYTYSRLYGNYSGLGNSDESGRSNPNNNRTFDSPYYYFDQSGSQQNVLGLLGTDRPHAFKLFGSYDIRSKIGVTTFGLNQIAFSGTPDSTSVIYLTAPTFPLGRGDLGRTPFYTQTDLHVSHAFKFTERVSLRLEGDARNLFNQAAVISRVTQINRSSAITERQLPINQFFAGYDVRKFVFTGSTVPPYNSIYRLPGTSYRAGGGPGDTLSSAFAATNPNFGAYQDFRALRLGIRLIF